MIENYSKSKLQSNPQPICMQCLVARMVIVGFALISMSFIYTAL